MNRAETFFTETERERLRQAVVKAEERSVGEVVPMIVDRSGAYTAFPLTASLLLMFLVALLWVVFRPQTSAVQMLALEMLTFLAGLMLARKTEALWLHLVPDALIADTVRRRAEGAFFEHRLHETRARTGILIFVSLLERRVWVVADVGIHKKVPPQTWEGLVGQIVSGIKRHQTCTAFCEAITACGDLLAHHFPKRPGDPADTDELPSLLIKPDEGSASSIA